MGALADPLSWELGLRPGAFAARQRTSATLVTRAADGSFEYGREVDVTPSLGRWMELLELGTLYWFGIEVRHPKNWFASAPLRHAY